MTLLDLARVRPAAQRVARWRAARRDHAALAHLSDHLLRDIGFEPRGERLPIATLARRA